MKAKLRREFNYFFMDTLVVCEKGKEKALSIPGPTVTFPKVNSVAQFQTVVYTVIFGLLIQPASY